MNQKEEDVNLNGFFDNSSKGLEKFEHPEKSEITGIPQIGPISKGSTSCI